MLPRPPDALTNSEAFLAAVSSCGVTLIEMHAKDTGVPLAGMDVTIEGVRTAAGATEVKVAVKAVAGRRGAREDS